jgi:3-hydroxybutyryl-CoA dehydrogenase
LLNWVFSTACPSVLFDSTRLLLKKRKWPLVAGLGKLVAKNKLSVEAQTRRCPPLTITTDMSIGAAG